MSHATELAEIEREIAALLERMTRLYSSTDLHIVEVRKLKHYVKASLHILHAKESLKRAGYT